MLELDLVKKIQKGDVESFSLLYDMYIKKIYNFIYYKTYHRENAEDLTSLTFTKSLEKIQQFNCKKGSFSSWIYTIARNCVIDYFRTLKLEYDIDDIWGLSDKEDVDLELDNRIELQKVRKYLSKLPLEKREIIIMKLWQGMSYREISEILNKTEASCKMAFSRTLKDLKKYEKELKSIIGEIISLKPNLQINDVFVKELKDKLLKSQCLNKKLNYKFMSKKNLLFAFSGAFVAFLLFFSFSQFMNNENINKPSLSLKPSFNNKKDISSKLAFSDNFEGLKKFKSSEEFKEYIEKANQVNNGGRVFSGMTRRMGSMEVMEDSIAPQMMTKSMDMDSDDGSFSNEVMPNRVSDTNVQVLNIDEADIVKTDGKNIYFSNNYYPSYRDDEDDIILEKMRAPRRYDSSQATKIIQAFPASEMKELAEIDKMGNLFLHDNVLVIFSGKDVIAYDVQDPTKPERKWKFELEDNTNLADSRLYDGQLYLVTNTYFNDFSPCPIRPFTNGLDFELNCSDIYYPSVSTNVDSTFVVSKLNLENGKLENKVSFLASSYESTVYMSEDSFYITYPYYSDRVELFYDFFKNNAQDLVSGELMTKIEKLISYDISNNTKESELGSLLNKYFSSLSRDESLKTANEFENRMSDYLEKNARNLGKTGIVKVGIDNFNILANASVPGKTLNQFSLDEYEGNLRIATTINNNSVLGFGGGNKSFSDVYVLNKDLKTQGSVLGLGETERIYSVRFVGKTAYVVTFREIDPFYVLDLSNPKKPSKKGELKIPGYSSYLHPLSQDFVLGIGKDGSKVKLSIFDVSNPSKPTEKDKYILDEYWSEAVNNHHAFLLDKKHESFFLPGGKGAYIFSYENNKFKLEKALSQKQVKRAVYIDDFMYIISNENIRVLDEKDWKEVKKLDLEY